MAQTTRPPFGGTIGRTFAESTPSWPDHEIAPCYGSDIRTPTFDSLAGQGLRYTNYHTTALCSPTRAALLTGRNHHSVGMARVADVPSGFPGYNAEMSHEDGMLSEILVRNG
ncbi:MAG: arylsulfatase, partial [Actinobacteria bacterium]|nr:arylsulfatase [Actinomycetota bacterium]